MTQLAFVALAAIATIVTGLGNAVGEQIGRALLPWLTALWGQALRQPQPALAAEVALAAVFVALGAWLAWKYSLLKASRIQVRVVSTLDQVFARLMAPVAAAINDIRDKVTALLDRDRDQPGDPTNNAGNPVVEQAPDLPDPERIPSPEPALLHGPPLDLNKLPAPPPRLIGRDAEVGYVVDRLTSGARLTVIVGGPGVGKSVLASRAVERALQATSDLFPGGIAVTRSADANGPITDATAILQKNLARFDPYRRYPHPDQIADEARELLAGRKALIILDDVPYDTNFAEIIETLRLDGVQLILIARNGLPPDAALCVPPDAVLEIGLLAEPDALELFAVAFGRPSAASLSAPEARAAQRIVKVLENHPLAIILSAHDALARGLPAVARDLEAGSLLTDMLGQRYLLAIENSVNALPDREKRLLTALAAFEGTEMGEDGLLDVARAIGVELPSVALRGLISRYLVTAESNAQLPRAEMRPRIRVHSTLRAYFRRIFDELPDDRRALALRTVASHYATRVEWVARQTRENDLKQRRHDNLSLQRVLTADILNVTAAIRWARDAGEQELLVRLCAGMSGYWADRWLIAASQEFLAPAIAVARKRVNNDKTGQAAGHLTQLELTYATMLRREGDLGAARNLLRGVLRLRNRVGDKHGAAACLYQLGIVEAKALRYGHAQRYFAQSLAYAIALGSQRERCIAISQIGRVARARGRLLDADELFITSLALAESLPPGQRDPRLIATVLGYRGRVARAQGRKDDAEKFFKQSLTAASDAVEPDARSRGRALSHLGRIALMRAEEKRAHGEPVETLRELERAKSQLLEGLRISRRVRDRASDCATVGYLGLVELAHADLAPSGSEERVLHLDHAESLFAASKRAAERYHDQRRISIASSQLGRVALLRDRLKEASRLFHASLRRARANHDAQTQGVALFWLGRLAERRGQTLLARWYYWRAEIIATRVDNAADLANAKLARAHLKDRSKRARRKPRA